MPPLRLPALDSQTARQRDIDLQGIIQSGHYVIMPLCHHAVKDFTGKRSSHIPFFLNGMMT